MTKFTVLQKILVTISAIFGATGVVVFFLPQFAPVAEEVTKYVAMASEIIGVICGVWIFGTHDQVLSEEEIKANEQKTAEKIACKEAKFAQKNALRDAKKELKEKQVEELKALAEQKLQEQKEKNVSIAKEV